MKADASLDDVGENGDDEGCEECVCSAFNARS